MRLCSFVFVYLFVVGSLAFAQDPDPHASHQNPSSSSSPWMVMTDGVIFATLNHQGTDRGGTEFKSTNWFMAMASRPAGPGQLTLSGMLSLDPLTATGRGYRELFQSGEAYKGEPIVDRQHPHDFLMQAAVVWRIPLNQKTAFTIAGAPVGEPALGPVAFMHRRSAAENPAAPLGHHTFDSTHIAMGVITAAVERGPWTIESSLFHGREPDDNRWDLMDPGALDSWSARVWFNAGRGWTLQGSHGFLSQPEELEEGDVRRTTASAAWMNVRADGSSAVTLAYGRNDKEHGAFNALLAEATELRGAMAYYGRFENLDTETDLLLRRAAGHQQESSRVSALTIGAVRSLRSWREYEIGAGADVTVYGIPSALESAYGTRAASLHVFLRVRPPASSMGRMWNMFMGKPMH